MQALREAWNRMNLVQRVVLLTVVLACGGAVAMLVGWARTPSLALLYSGLEPEEASRIVEKVRESGVPYEIRGGGTSVYVSEDKVYSLRLELAGQGLPAGDQRGYKILDDEKIGTSPFTQRLNFRRAIEGEIARSIQVLDGVVSARVHVVRPENSLFGGQEKASSATVVLKLKPGWHESPRNIAAIIHMVAGSVEGLKPENVVVVDSSANLLSGNVKDEFARGAGTFLDSKTQHEEYLAHKVEDMLSQVLGPGRATVRVSCLMDNSSGSTTSEVYDPAAKVALKEETKTKSASGAEATSSGSGTTKEETQLTDYAVGRTVKHEVVVPGKVTSISVAAFVDLSAPPAPAAAADGTTPPPAAPAPTLKAADVETIIRNALGLKETDSIKVVETPFHRPETTALAATEEASDSSRAFYLDIARQGSLGVLVIGILVALKIVSGPRKRQAAGAASGGTLMGASTGAMGALPMPGSSLEENPALLKSRITAALQENPEEVKRLFMAWAEGRHEGA
jgi:flagellar M-ring protein FliF